VRNRFANDAEMRSHGSLYAEEAKKILKDNLEHVCIENIQACILVGNICLGDSDPNAESLYFGDLLSPPPTLDYCWQMFTN
jgi:hypothetical protein